MNTTKTISLIIAALAVMSIMLLIIQLLMRRIKVRISTGGKFKLSFGVFFCTLFLTTTIIASKAINLFAEAIDNIYKINSQNFIGQTARIGALFIGLSAVWFIVWYFIVNVLSISITGKRNEEKEIESDNYSYFLIKGALHIGFNVCLLPIFEIILRSFMVSIQLPFYH